MSLCVEKEVPVKQVVTFRLPYKQVEVLHQEKCKFDSFPLFLASKRWQKLWDPSKASSYCSTFWKLGSCVCKHSPIPQTACSSPKFFTSYQRRKRKTKIRNEKRKNKNLKIEIKKWQNATIHFAHSVLPWLRLAIYLDAT